MRKNIEQLIKSGITAHTVAAETGLPRNTVYRIFTKETKLDNVKFATVETLNNYYLKEMEKMKIKLEELQEQVKENIHLSESKGRFYAEVVEDNGDEHRLAEADNIEDLRGQLKQFGQIK